MTWINVTNIHKEKYTSHKMHPGELLHSDLTDQEVISMKKKKKRSNKYER